MASNFQFLKKVNSNLFDIISEAEKLYRDEYFEQCMTQTRRFGEQICKDMLEQNNKQTGSFDEMLATLKDHTNGHVQEKEFIDDLYFLKKNGNQSVHSGKVKKEGMVALECLKRAFEVAINYCVYNQGAPANILKLEYDVELLVTEQKSKTTLKERYLEEKKKEQSNIEKKKEVKVATKPFQPKIQKKDINKKIKISFFWRFVLFTLILSIVTSLVLAIIVFVSSFAK